MPLTVAALVEQGLRSTVAFRSVAALAVLLVVCLAAGAAVFRHATEDKRSQHTPPTAAALPPAKQAQCSDRFGDPLPPGALVRLGTVRLRQEKRARAGIAFTPDSKVLLAPGTDGFVYFWEVGSGKQRRKLRVQNGVILAFAVSRDGKLLAAAVEDSIAVWDLAAEKRLWRLTIKGTRTLTFAPDGKSLAAWGEEQALRVWEPRSGKERLQLAARAWQFRSLCFGNDGKTLVAVSPNNGSIHFWDVTQGKELRTIKCGRYWTSCLAVSPDGKMLVSGGHFELGGARYESQLVLWDLATGRELRRWPSYKDRVEALAFAPDGKTLAAGGDQGIRVWEAVTGKELHRIEGDTNFSNFVVFSPNGRTLASYANMDPTLRLWDAATARPLHQRPGHEGWVEAVDFSPDGRLVATACYDWNDHTVRIWDARTGTQRRVLRGHEAYIRQLRFASDGKSIFSGSGDGTLRHWDVNTGRELHVFPLRKKRERWKDQVLALAVSPDAKQLASVSLDDPDGGEKSVGKESRRQTVVTWDTATGKEVARHRWRLGPQPPTFSPDAKILAGVHRLTVRVEEPATGNRLCTLQASPTGRGSEGLCEPVAFVADGSVLAALHYAYWRDDRGRAARELTLHLWELATGTEILKMPVQGG